jgi:hypothetical protein
MPACVCYILPTILVIVEWILARFAVMYVRREGPFKTDEALSIEE